MDVQNNTLLELIETAELGGKLKACDAIFKILQMPDATPEDITAKLAEYHAALVNELRKRRTKNNLGLNVMMKGRKNGKSR